MRLQVLAGWNGWRRITGEICDRMVSANGKGKVFKTVVKSARLYWVEIFPLTERQEAELKVAKLKMLRCSIEVSRMDKIKNKYKSGQHKRQVKGSKIYLIGAFSSLSSQRSCFLI